MAAPAEILLVENDPAALAQLKSQLENQAYAVRTATDGLQGLAAIMMRPPDVIIANANTPKMDGLGLLASVRGNERTRGIPFIVLADPTDAARARSGGADAVIGRPATRDMLVGSITECLRSRPTRTLSSASLTGPTLNGASRARTGTLAELDQASPRLEQHTLPANFAQFVDKEPTTMIGESILDAEADVASQTISKRNTVGTVLFSDIRNFSTISEQLESEEVVEMLNAYFARACEPIQRQHGWVVKFLGDGMVSLFESPPGHLQDHAERAVKAGLLMVLAAARFKAWIAERHPHRRLPEFSIGVGLHTGEVTVCKMGSAESVETTMIGDNVNIAARLEEKTKELGWSVVASQATFEAAGARIVCGQRSELMVKGRIAPVGIVEMLGLQPKISSTEHERKFYEAVGAAVAANSRTLRANLVARQAIAAASGAQVGLVPDALRIPGFALERKLGEGGMSQVWLARRDSNQQEVVLKLLQIQHNQNQEALQRFIQEYALISQIEHPNVARIYEQGFSETHAYIAMEHFPGGDLRALTKGGLAADVAQAVLIQIAGALAAIHSRGIVHRDMKPDNVMLRNDGSLALADFGIAKHVEMHMTHTKHGEVFGTPYYLSPEQALGAPVDRRSDIYSLGVMLYEMLAGKKPYYADNAQALLYQHVHSPVPVLPAQHARFQPLVQRMMAKRPQDRFATADEVIDAVVRL